MTYELRHGAYVDVEQFAEDLKTLADDLAGDPIRAGMVSASVTQEVHAEDVETVTLTLEVRPGESSVLGEGYTIPYEHD